MKLYKIVGITEGSPTAKDELTLSDLKKAYKEAALKCHPDKNLNDKKATEKFIKLKDAFDQLTKGMQG
jgi:DnaJ-class molecular chaperone